MKLRKCNIIPVCGIVWDITTDHVEKAVCRIYGNRLLEDVDRFIVQKLSTHGLARHRSSCLNASYTIT